MNIDLIAPHLQALEKKVRFAQEPDNPTLLRDFVIQQINFAKHSDGRQSQCLEALFRTLLEVAADEVLPAHWRIQCLDYMHRPLSELWNDAKNDDDRWQIKRLYRELDVVGSYVASSINNHHSYI